MGYTVYEPEYYSQFSCIGGACHHTCCRDWRIGLSITDYESLHALEGPPKLVQTIGETFLAYEEGGTYKNYGVVVHGEDGLCPMFHEDGLCEIQRCHGHDYLPQACRTFPRRVHYYWNAQLLKRSCSPGCEEVLRLLMEETGRIRFRRYESDAPMDPLATVLSAPNRPDHVGNNYLADVQSALIAILQNRSYPLSDRMILLGAALREFDTMWAHPSPAGIEDWLTHAHTMGTGDGFADYLIAFPRPEDEDDGIRRQTYSMLLTAQFHPSFRAICDLVLPRLGVELDGGDTPGLDFTLDAATYRAARQRFEEACPAGTILLEHLMVNHLFRSHIPMEDEGVWSGFQRLVICYNLLRFVMYSAYDPPLGPDSLIPDLVVVCRTFLHDMGLQNWLVVQLKTRQSDALDHLALLLRG